MCFVSKIYYEWSSDPDVDICVLHFGNVDVRAKLEKLQLAQDTLGI
jgi:hypothetical protein